jgi:2-polyprenyl-6-methoxyphenol hydroxylase-like FAD-dependent oxidoreductase
MRVLICGGGIAGLTLAWCLARRGHTPVLAEKAGKLRDEGYMIDFFGSGYEAYERLGLLPELDRIHYPVDRLTFVDARGHERFSLPYPALRKRLFEDRHFNFPRGALERVLYQKIEGGVDIRFNTTVDSVEQRARAVGVRLSDGSDERFDLLVGADGVHSHIRRLAFAEDRQFTRLLGFRTAAFILPKAPRGLDIANAFVTLTVPNKQVAVYPLHGGRLATFFIHRSGPESHAVSRESALRELRLVYGRMGWIVPELLELSVDAPSLYFDAVSQVVMPRWSNGRIVLLGDSCQCVSLLAGQGASMAVAAAYVLAEELADAQGVGAALSRYERRLKPSIERKQAAGRRIAGWFVPESNLRLALRNLSLRVSVWPPVSAVFRRGLAADESLFSTGLTASR